MPYEIHLASRPTGMPDASNFKLVEVPLPQPGEGQVLVRNIYMSVDPYMRGRMIDRKSYTPPFQLGQALQGGCVGQVVESNINAFKVGDHVLGMQGWREYYTSDGQGLTKVDPDLAPLSAYLGGLGMPGMTAYVGLLDIGQPEEGETVFVSAASGAVGSIVCQIARIKGCRVVGSAGSDEKVAWLVDRAGIDGAFNYKKVDSINAEVGRLCPDGIDITFENVGGEHLEAAINHMNDFGRIVACGMIAQYNATQPQPAPHNLASVISKRLLMKGFIISDHYDRLPAFYADMGKWINEGRIRWEETIVEGIEKAPEAFISLFTGDKIGKMLVRLGPDSEM